jgi:pyruvate dehydrogenase E1 component
MFGRFDDIFETCGWRVVTLKYGKLQRAAFQRPGGKASREWIDNCPNADFAALTYQGGAAWRSGCSPTSGGKPKKKLIAGFDDEALAGLMTNLGGHCIETLLDAFAAADDDKPTMFIAYTVKGYGLPLRATRTIMPG